MTTPHRLTQADIATIVTRLFAGVGYPEFAEGLSAHEDQARKAYDSYIFLLNVLLKHKASDRPCSIPP
jgi:hypothetical protein